MAAMLNLCNFLGRIVWGVVAERVGHKTFFIYAGIVQTAALGLMALCIHANSFAGWIACFLTVGEICSLLSRVAVLP